MKQIVTIVPVLLLALWGCNSYDTQTNSLELVKGEIQSVVNGEVKTMWRKGEVRFFNLEGGFYGLIADNGDKLLPMNLNKKYKQHGAIIQFQGHYIKDMMTIQQWGQVYKITKVQLIKAGRSTSQPTH
ncbi:hypothetical protein [Thalassotalea atypica]|uniref:hypothetical protein n=1 Tax=Thalassotalea atypica TaxID=2054316 RepID=UPI002573872E|nr:hypothetical protein [Thalassotalea atypica]